MVGREKIRLVHYDKLEEAIALMISKEFAAEYINILQLCMDFEIWIENLVKCVLKLMLKYS